MADQRGRQDKFASIKAKQMNVVKRDKFASMAARQNEAASPCATEKPSTSIPSNARPDKFASMAAAKKNEATPPAEKVKSAPKRDKFASINQMKRDKFASMAQTQRNRDSSSQESKENGDLTEIKKKDPHARMRKLEQRINQRQKIMKDLEKAEGQVWNLILLAGKTAKSLTNLKIVDDNSGLSYISSQYRENLQHLHSLLSPHAKFVKAYQNHKEEAETKNMYAARVETRLAQERRNVIEEFLNLEKKDKNQGLINDNNKRRREE